MLTAYDQALASLLAYIPMAKAIFGVTRAVIMLETRFTLWLSRIMRPKHSIFQILFLHQKVLKPKGSFCTQKPVSYAGFKDFSYTSTNQTQIWHLIITKKPLKDKRYPKPSISNLKFTKLNLSLNVHIFLHLFRKNDKYVFNLEIRVFEIFRLV